MVPGHEIAGVVKAVDQTLKNLLSATASGSAASSTPAANVNTVGAERSNFVRKA